MKKITRSAALVLAALLCFMLTLSACGSAKMAYDAPQAADEGFYSADAGSYAVTAESEAKSAGTDALNSSDSVYNQKDVKLIRRAWLDVQSTQFDEDLTALRALVAQVGGYFERSDLYTGGYYTAAEDCRTGEYVVRVPAKEYDRFLTGLDGIGTITRRSENTEDVGEVYYDLESRLKTQRIKLERLQTLLAKANKMEDIISIENAISDVEYSIENLSADLRRYDALIDYATFTISLQEVVRLNVTPGEKESLAKRMGAGVVSSVRDLMDGLQEVCIWFAYHLIGILFSAAVIAAVIVLVKRAVRKWKQPKTQPRAAKKPAAQEEESE